MMNDGDPIGSVGVLRRLHHHRMWSDALLREAVARAKLSNEQLQRVFPMGRGSLMATGTHLYAAESIWIEVLSGNAAAPGPDAFTFDSWEALCDAWPATDARWRDYLAGLTPDMLTRKIARQRTLLTGEKVSLMAAVMDVLIHVCTHAQYTLAQAVNMMRQLGVAPEGLPDTQMIMLARSETTAEPGL